MLGGLEDKPFVFLLCILL